MYSFAIIAMTNQGKSKYARQLITKPPMDQFGCLVYDVNNEYGEFRQDRDTGALQPSTNLTTDTSQYRSRYAGKDMNMKDFFGIVKTKEYTSVIFEEATGFFKGRTSEELCQMVINKGHTHNNYIFLFHSIRSIPPELLGFMNFVILFKTGDSEDIVKQKDARLLPYWLDMQTKPDRAAPHVLNWLSEKPFNKANYEAMKRRLNMM